jgi:hypothetical protein
VTTLDRVIATMLAGTLDDADRILFVSPQS